MITLPLYGTVTAHAPCHVTYHRGGGKNDSHFWNSWPLFVCSLCYFHGATTKSNPRHRRKIAFSHCEGYKVYCACAVSRDLRMGAPKPHVTIFLPRITYSLYNLYGATTTIKGSFILSNFYSPLNGRSTYINTKTIQWQYERQKTTKRHIRVSRCIRIGPRCHFSCSPMLLSDGSELQWVDNVIW